MPRQTKDARNIEFARIREIDKRAIAIMSERGCSFSEAWQVALDGRVKPEPAWVAPSQTLQRLGLARPNSP